MRSYVALVLLSAAVACTRAPVASSTPRAADRLASAADQLADKILRDVEALGLTVVVARAGELAFVRSYGFTTSARDSRTTNDTAYALGEWSELTATAAMRLIEQGRLGLDDDVTRYVPLAAGGRTVTVRHLMTASSGVPDVLSTLPAPVEAGPTLEKLLTMIAEQPWAFEPGTEIDAFDLNELLLALVIEAASGRTFDDYVRTELFERAGVKGVVPCRGIASPRTAFTALCISAPEMMRFYLALSRGQVITPASFEQMHRQVEVPGGTQAALAHIVDREVAGEPALQAWTHGPGATALVILPRRGVLVLVAATRSAYGADRVARRLVRAELGKPFLEPELPPAFVEGAPGTYVNDDVETEISGFRNRLRARVAAGVSFDMEYEGGDTFYVPTNQATITFRREGEQVTGLRWEQGGQVFELDREP